MYKSGFKNKTILFKMHGFNIFCVKRNLSKLDAAGVVSCTFSKIPRLVGFKILFYL